MGSEWLTAQRCVDGYRESMRIARDKRESAQREKYLYASASALASSSVPAQVLERSDRGESEAQNGRSWTVPISPRISRVNRAVSRRLAHKGAWLPAPPSTPIPGAAVHGAAPGLATVRNAKVDTSETIWHLSEWSAVRFLFFP